MKNINSYKSRFYVLLESNLGDVRPILNEQSKSTGLYDFLKLFFPPKYIDDALKSSDDVTKGLKPVNTIKTSFKSIDDVFKNAFSPKNFKINYKTKNGLPDGEITHVIDLKGFEWPIEDLQKYLLEVVPKTELKNATTFINNYIPGLLGDGITNLKDQVTNVVTYSIEKNAGNFKKYVKAVDKGLIEKKIISILEKDKYYSSHGANKSIESVGFIEAHKNIIGRSANVKIKIHFQVDDYGDIFLKVIVVKENIESFPLMKKYGTKMIRFVNDKNLDAYSKFENNWQTINTLINDELKK